MKGAKFVISQQSEEGSWYVVSSPNIMFTKKISDAKQFSQKDALEAVSVLMTMQRISSSREPSPFTVECLKSNTV